MQLILLAILSFIPMIIAQDPTIIDSQFPWLRLPATPQLPSSPQGQYLQRNGFKIWYTTYGQNDGAPVLFLHGGFANSNYWGHQANELKSKYLCIMMDSRGQGRSTLSSTGISYDLMTEDVIALLNHLDIQKVHVVGWSDGGIIGLNMAMKYPSRLKSLFAFGASYNPSGSKDISTSAVFVAYLNRTRTEYQSLNPLANYTNLYNIMISMWSSSPTWTRTDFTVIDQNLPVWIADGDHEEAIYRNHTDTLTSWIVQAGELIIPRTSHFAFLQIPDLFTRNLERFLVEADCFKCNYSVSSRSSSRNHFSPLILCCFFIRIVFSNY